MGYFGPVVIYAIFIYIYKKKIILTTARAYAVNVKNVLVYDPSIKEIEVLWKEYIFSCMNF